MKGIAPDYCGVKRNLGLFSRMFDYGQNVRRLCGTAIRMISIDNRAFRVIDNNCASLCGILVTCLVGEKRKYSSMCRTYIDNNVYTRICVSPRTFSNCGVYYPSISLAFALFSDLPPISREIAVRSLINP